MKLELFFERFDTLTEAPEAMANLRELVLDLAVRGRLTFQDATDEPAKQLLKRAIAAKNRLKGRGDLSDEEQDSPPDDEAFDIPVSWEWIGATTPAVMVSEQGKKIQTKDIRDRGKYPVVDQGKMFIRGYCDDSSRVIRVGEPIVLFGDHTRETKFIDFDFVVGADGVKLLQPICIDPRFYFLVLRWLPLESRGYARHFKLLKAARIPLPPLAEQKRIVAKVDELMVLCDRLEVQQQEREARHAVLARASLDRFADAPTAANLVFLFHPSYTIPSADLRKSILTLAIQGKLVPQDPRDEPVEHSLAQSDERRRATARSDHRADEENQPLLSGEDRWDISDTWSWRGLADLVLFVDYRGKTPAKLSSGVRLLTAKNVRKGRINLSPEEFLSESEYHAWMTRGFPNAGDVLFTTEAPMGNASVVELTERFALAQRVICFQSYGAIEPAFLVLEILSDEFQFILNKNGTGVTAKGIKASRLKQLPIAIPPIAEQRRIVDKVGQLMALVDELETQLAVSRTTAANLLSAVVAELTGATRDCKVAAPRRRMQRPEADIQNPNGAESRE